MLINQHHTYKLKSKYCSINAVIALHKHILSFLKGYANDWFDSKQELTRSQGAQPSVFCFFAFLFVFFTLFVYFFFYFSFKS